MNLFFLRFKKRCLISKLDLKAIASLDFLFFIFSVITIAILILGLFQSQFNSLSNLDENIQGKLILEKVSNYFNQVSQSSDSFSMKFSLPEKIDNYNYIITVDSNNLFLEFNNKKTREIIFPINLFNKNTEKVNQIKIYSGYTYMLSSIDRNQKNGVMIKKL
jgi:hypothetical protein